MPRQTIISADAKPPLFAGVDLGGTNIKIGLVDDLGRTLEFRTIATEVPSGPDAAIGRAASTVLEMIRQSSVKSTDVPGIGLGSPGTMDIPAGMLLKPVNLPGWENYPIRDRLSQACKLPVTFTNDANAAAFGEFWLGSGQNMRSLVMLTLGTGIGCGIVVEGKLIEGRHSHGAECGHAIIDCRDDARMCPCGQRGHLEAYCSATSLVKRAIEALESGMRTSLNARMEHGAPLTARLIAEEAAAGDPLASEIVDDTARYLAAAIVNLMHTIDPDRIVLGGAMDFGGPNSSLGRRFLQHIRDEVGRKAFPIPAQQTTIEFASLGSYAGYLGAAGLARAAYQHQ